MANTKSKSKTTKKKGSVFSKINFGSTKTRIIVTLLVFGVIGGGFTVYKSFAATSEISFKSSNGGLTCMVKTNCTRVRAPEKGNNYVLKLTGSDKYFISGSARGFSNFSLPIGSTTSCVTAKGYGFLKIRFADNISLGDVAVTDTSTYKLYCGTANAWRVTNTAPNLMWVEYTAGTAPVYVSAIGAKTTY